MKHGGFIRESRKQLKRKPEWDTEVHIKKKKIRVKEIREKKGRQSKNEEVMFSRSRSSGRRRYNFNRPKKETNGKRRHRIRPWIFLGRNKDRHDDGWVESASSLDQIVNPSLNHPQDLPQSLIITPPNDRCQNSYLID